jgi:hypothetical protein
MKLKQTTPTSWLLNTDTQHQQMYTAGINFMNKNGHDGNQVGTQMGGGELSRQIEI